MHRRPDGTTAPGDGRLPSLTGARFFAAFSVFACHALVLGYLHPATQARLSDTAFALGWLGVEFFFVLSGFVLTWSVRTAGPASSFWRRRLAKVFPNHVVTWLAALGLAVWAGHAVDPANLLPSLFLVHTWLPRGEFILTVNVVTWSLACELFFYLAFPLLYALLRRIPEHRLWHAAAAVTAVILLLPAAALLWVPGTPRLPGQEMSLTQNWFLVSFPPVRALDFVLGILAARIVLAGRAPNLSVPGALALLAAGFAAQVALWPTVYGLTATVVVPVMLLIMAIASADLRGAPSLLRSRPLLFLGEISFASYLVHYLVLSFAHLPLGASRSWDAPAAAAVIAALFGVTTLLSWGLHRLVEVPAMRRWSRPRPAAAPAPLDPPAPVQAPVAEPT